MNRTIILYLVAALQLALGLYILVDAYPMFKQGVITPLNYVVRGVVPLILAATFIFLARQLRTNKGSDNA